MKQPEEVNTGLIEMPTSSCCLYAVCIILGPFLCNLTLVTLNSELPTLGVWAFCEAANRVIDSI